jgi:uncharacterized membrane protein YhhN
MKNISLVGLYLLITSFNIISAYRFPGLPAYISKVLIIPVLALLLIVNIRQDRNSTHVLFLAALLFSWAGDILLETKIPHGSLFVPGLIAFLLAHIMYITVFVSTPGSGTSRINPALQLIPLVLYGILLLIVLNKDLGSMKIPVIIYSLVILTMVYTAAGRYGKAEPQSYWLVLAGAILFLISDSALAINKFSYPFRLSSLVVMSTYAAAQLLIVAGYILQFRNKSI